jgi:hypothetical protein
MRIGATIEAELGGSGERQHGGTRTGETANDIAALRYRPWS